MVPVGEEGSREPVPHGRLCQWSQQHALKENWAALTPCLSFPVHHGGSHVPCLPHGAILRTCAGTGSSKTEAAEARVGAGQGVPSPGAKVRFLRPALHPMALCHPTPHLPRTRGPVSTWGQGPPPCCTVPAPDEASLPVAGPLSGPDGAG